MTGPVIRDEDCLGKKKAISNHEQMEMNSISLNISFGLWDKAALFFSVGQIQI